MVAKPGRKWAALLLSALATSAALAVEPATPAIGDSYAVLSCPGDEGWAQQSPSALFVLYQDSCAGTTAGTLSLALGPNPTSEYASATGGAITFSAGGRAIDTYTMHLLAYGAPCAIADGQCANGFGDVYVDHTGQADPDYDYRNLGYGTQAITVNPGELPSGVSWVTIGVGCDGGPGGDPCPGQDEGGPEAAARITSAAFVLSSNATPTASNFTGSLLEGQAHGTATLRFLAEDASGPGIYQVAVQIDGQTVYRGTPDGNEGRCAPIGAYEGEVMEFEKLQPCKQAEAVEIPVDTTELADGQHTLTVSVTDAAGTSSVVYSGTISTANRTSVSALLDSPLIGAVSGEVAPYAVVLSHGTEALGKRLRRPYDDSAVAFSGTLRSSAATPVPGVTMSLLTEEGNQVSGGWRVVARTTTNAAGAWSLHAGKGPSRRLQLVYGAASAASLGHGVAFTEIVRPSLGLRVASRGGGRIVFSGRLQIHPLGNPTPLVSIQTRGPAGWETVGIPIRVQPNGNYSYSFPSSPITYGRRFAFRATTPKTSLWSSASSPIRETVIR